MAGDVSVSRLARTDGVSVDQVVLSSRKYATSRPGAAKTDTTILQMTVPWE